MIREILSLPFVYIIKTDDKMFDRSFCVCADDFAQAEWFLNTYGQQLTELRDNMGQFSLEYAGDMQKNLRK